MTKILCMISTYKERELLPSCIESAKWCDAIIIYEGRTDAEDNKFGQPLSDAAIQGEIRKGLGKDYWKPFLFRSGDWTSDADKRTDMLKLAKEIDRDAWGLWLDGDEVLLWGEYLHDHCRRAEEETATGGTTLRIVEYDGSVAQCYGKLIRLDAVKRYVMSSYEIELSTGMTVALPNVKICSAGGIPFVHDEFGITQVDDERLATHRPPLQGEPHLLHRHGLRRKNREAPRLHDSEADSFAQLVQDAGLEGVDKQTAERIENG